MNAERRSTERVKTGYKAEIIYGNNTYSGTVENISASGINVLTDPLDAGIEFRPDDPIDFSFTAYTGEKVVVKCVIMWSSKIPPSNVRHRIGAQIVSLPLEKFGYFL